MQRQSSSGASPERPIIALRREPADGPPLFRLIVIPGSGCTGFAPIAGRYFNGLTKAQIIVLHKPYSERGLAPAECSAEFVGHDALGNWRDDVLAALRQLDSGAAKSLPTIVLGISEGAEILPYLLLAVANPMGMAPLGMGLDPAVAGEMQAERLGQGAAWMRLKETSASSQPDHTVVEGRSLRYWRDLFGGGLPMCLPRPAFRCCGSGKRRRLGAS